MKKEGTLKEINSNSVGYCKVALLKDQSDKNYRTVFLKYKSENMVFDHIDDFNDLLDAISNFVLINFNDDDLEEYEETIVDKEEIKENEEEDKIINKNLNSTLENKIKSYDGVGGYIG